MRRLLVILCCWFGLVARSAEVIPDVPTQYFNDYAGVVSSGVAAQLNDQLKQFERDHSSQIVVAIYPKMQSDSSIEDYTVRVAHSWKVGQKGKDNGAVLFVFTQDHKMYLQVGYGLEGVLPDALCKRIISDDIAPDFKAGHFDAGLSSGVNAILAAARGEYQGTGKTVAEHNYRGHSDGPFTFFMIVLAIIIISIFLNRLMSHGSRGGYYSSSGWSGSGWSTWSAFNSGSSWDSSSSSSGSGFSSSDSGFSSGGGDFGGGGAGGSW